MVTKMKKSEKCLRNFFLPSQGINSQFKKYTLRNTNQTIGFLEFIDFFWSDSISSEQCFSTIQQPFQSTIIITLLQEHIL